jgi:hypothetical protein
MFLREALDKFFARANSLNGLLNHIEMQLGGFRNRALDEMKEDDERRPRFVCGSSVVVRDLTEWAEDGWARYHWTGGFDTQDEEFLKVTDRLMSREAAWTIAQGFEGFESCVKDLLAAFYHAHSTTADPALLRGHGRSLQQKGLDSSTLEFWSALVRREYRSPDDVLRVVRQIAPQLVEAENKNNRACDLTKWFTVVSEFRHAVTHSNLTISTERWSALGRDGQALAEELFEGIREGGAYELRPTPKEAGEALCRLAEYGYAVFKALCIAGGHDWRIFPDDGDDLRSLLKSS